MDASSASLSPSAASGFPSDPLAGEAGADGAPALTIPWAPLIAVATTTLHSCTPFRRLGLSPLAGARDIQRRLEQLRLSLELGAPEFAWAFAPVPPPTVEQLRDSAQQLKDTLTRLLHECFWFWPASYPDDGADPALESLLSGDADAAFLRWQNDAAAGRIVAVHNLALFHQFAALEIERAGGDIGEEAAEWWATSIAQWKQVRASEEFWELLRQRIVLLQDPRLPAGLLEAIRGTLPDAFCALHAALAIARAQRGQWHEATAHVRFARDVHDVPARAERALEAAIAKVVQGVDLQVRDTTRRLGGDGAEGLSLTAGLLAEAAAALEIIETICGRDAEVYREVSTRVVDAALEGIIAYQRRTLDSCGVLPWLTHLTTLVATPEVRRRLEDTADILHGNAIAEKLPPFDEAAGAPGREAAEFEAAYRLLLEEFVPGADRLQLGPRARADYLANVRRALRELAHAACYQLENFDLAARALATAAEVSEGAERAALSREREQLLLEIVRRKARELAAEHARAAAEAAAIAVTPANPVQSELALWSESVAAAEPAAPGPRLHLEAAGHRLEIEPTRLTFDGVTLAPDEITGVRYGVVGTARHHRIAWSTADTVVLLDETNLFGATGGDAAALYAQILDALYHTVVPGLIARLVGWVQRGDAVALGPAWLRRDGLVFSGRSFHWPIDTAVPYSRVVHALEGDEFVVRPSPESGDSERFPMAEIWNAAIAGHVIDALASATPYDAP